MKEEKTLPKFAGLVCSVIILAILLLSGAHAQQRPVPVGEPVKWTIISGWLPQQSAGVEIFLIPWVEKVNKAAGGRLIVKWAGPEATPAWQQFKPVRDGVYDGHYTHGAYNMGDTPLLSACDLIVASASERRAAGWFDLMNKMLEAKRANQIHLLEEVGWPNHTVLKRKPKQGLDLKGFKIRTTPYMNPFYTALGASCISIPMGEVYSALEKGVVDGVGTGSSVKDMKLNEVTKYIVEPSFFENVTCMLNINRDSWNRLPDDLKEIVIKAGMEVEKTCHEAWVEKWEREKKELLKGGMEIYQVSPKEEMARLRKLFAEVMWAEEIKLDPEFGPKAKELAMVKKLGAF